MNLLKKIKYYQNWNIGICEQTPDELLRDKKLARVKWLNHPYRDRWFADPFIYKVTENEIVVFVEECSMEIPKGILCELVIERKTMQLKKRYVMLELETHLSYPAIIWHEGKVYVYPENGASGQLDIYEYDDINHRLINPVCILKEALADATITKQDELYYLSATKCPNTQEKAYMYVSDSLFGLFRQIQDTPYQSDRCCSRQGGNWLIANKRLYRPAQDCVLRYGSALSIMDVTLSKSIVSEKLLFQIQPICYRYKMGVHTINFFDGLCVIDGCGYYYPIAGLFIELFRKIKHFHYCPLKNQNSSLK